MLALLRRRVLETQPYQLPLSENVVQSSESFQGSGLGLQGLGFGLESSGSSTA